MISSLWGRLSAMTLAVIGCAVGRGLDFATTWVAVQSGRAAEAKPVAAQLFDWLGLPGGIIAYEALITTPAIFLGFLLVRRSLAGQHAAAERVFFLAIGVVSACAALHNSQFLL